jgi:hypothetical protein
MSRRTIPDEATILQVCRSRGTFVINPLSWRAGTSELLQRLEKMRRQGLLAKREWSLDHVSYFIPERKP